MRDHALIVAAILIGVLVLVRAPGTLRSGTAASRRLLGALAALTMGIAAMSPQVEKALARDRSVEHLNQPFARTAIILAVLLGHASLSDAVGGADRRAVRRSSIGAAIAVLLVLMLFSLSPGRPRVPYGDDAATDPLAGALVLVFIAYVSWVAAQILQTARHHANQQAGPARTTLRWIAVGTVLGLTYSVIKSAQVITLMLDRPLPTGLASLAQVFAAAGALCVAAGAAGLALRQNLGAVRRWGEMYVANRRLYRLWSDLHGVTETWQPSPPPGTAWHDALRLRGQHQRLYRRLIDLRDAWMRLRPYFDTDVIDRFRGQEPSTAPTEHCGSAALLRQALQLHAAGQEPARPWTPPTPATATADDELRWWLGVAAHWDVPTMTSTPVTDDVLLAMP